jgi:exodeoxyribonuclease V alpha subunit
MSDTVLHQPPLALTNNRELLNVLHSWVKADWIRWLDVEFAEFLYQEAQAAAQDVSPLLLLAAALCSHQNGHGHLCLDLQLCLKPPDRVLLLPPEHSSHTPAITPAALLRQISAEQWISALRQDLLCATDAETAATHAIHTPLVLDHSRLYLRRFWQYEQQVKQSLQQKLQTAVAVDEQRLARELDTLFPASAHSNTAGSPDWQKTACALSARSGFSIITGGPGTGKTTTVVKLLSLLQSLHSSPGELRIKLAAPTGKAAARLSASISAQVTSPNLVSTQQAQQANSNRIPNEVTTLHRLLGPQRHSRFFKHNAANPLPVDVVVIDEASMVDVEMMAQLLDALPAQARLILLGDKDQLASVEAGAVLGSLCARANEAHYLPATAAWAQRISGEPMPAHLVDERGRPLDQAITMLRYSHRFGAVPGIGALAQAVNRGAELSDIEALFAGQHTELVWLKTPAQNSGAFDKLICDETKGFGFYLQRVARCPSLNATPTDWDSWADEVLTAHSSFQILAALRHGESGVEELNDRIKHILVRQQLLDIDPNDADDWYIGRPVMITRNNYTLGLMNGDIGITLPYPNPAAPQGLSLRVAFRDSANPRQIRWILPTRLQHIETIFAMTVHKSQGSEFTHTALLLPAHNSAVLTRELVYTGITRASRQFTLMCADASVLEHAVKTRVFRAGGLEL